MKKIVLLGDSIRMGYDKYVKSALEGAAEVYYPGENCKFAEYMLRFAHEWKKSGDWGDDIDLVHWNAGLWDALELFEDEPLTSLDYYGEAIARIAKRLRMLFPKAKFVFATSTPVWEERCSKDFRRHNSTIEKYNERAIESLRGTETEINDLYALAKTFPNEYRSDAVHFYTDKGTEMLGGRVLSLICDILGIEAKEINIEGFEPEKYSEKNIGY